MSESPEYLKEGLEALDRITETVSSGHFYAYMPVHKYLFVPTRELWPAGSVNSRLPKMTGANGEEVSPSVWLDENRHVEQMTWAPGAPMIIEDRLVDQGGWIDQRGASAFNLYRPPTVKHGNTGDVGLWRYHLKKIFPNNADHLEKWFAHRVQRPGEKINHAVVLGGPQGIGKDALLEPVKAAVGPWNCNEVSPAAMLGRFNGFVKSVILRVSEARDLGDVDRFAFYDHMKVYTAAPPDVLRCDEKNLREHAVINVCGVIITTNHKTGGIYLPADDRRHYVAWSDIDRTAFDDEYWSELWSWYEDGGIENVAAYLATLDLSGFNAKAPPPRTDAWWHIVDAGRSTEEAEISDALDFLQNPQAVTVSQLIDAVEKVGHTPLADSLREPRSRKKTAHRLEELGYSQIRNDAARDGYWRIKGRRQPVYALRELSRRDQISAAQRLTM